jgi:hypothetical protein
VVAIKKFHYQYLWLSYTPTVLLHSNIFLTGPIVIRGMGRGVSRAEVVVLGERGKSRNTEANVGLSLFFLSSNTIPYPYLF